MLTSAGVAAGIDLCLHVVARDHGAAAANAIARRMVVAPHRGGGQAQFVERALPERTDDGLGATRTWMLERLEQPLTVAAMARHAVRSERSFMRHFRAETGSTPLRWLHEQRILHARRLLEETDLPVEDIAAGSGFGTATTLREHFRRADAHDADGLPARVQGAGRRAVTSISTRMRGSIRSHDTIVAAGRASSNALRSTGQHGSKSTRFGNM